MSRFFALAARTEHQGNKKPASEEPAGFCYAFKKEKFLYGGVIVFLKKVGVRYTVASGGVKNKSYLFRCRQFRHSRMIPKR